MLSDNSKRLSKDSNNSISRYNIKKQRNSISYKQNEMNFKDYETKVMK